MCLLKLASWGPTIIYICFLRCPVNCGSCSATWGLCAKFGRRAAPAAQNLLAKVCRRPNFFTGALSITRFRLCEQRLLRRSIERVCLTRVSKMPLLCGPDGSPDLRRAPRLRQGGQPPHEGGCCRGAPNPAPPSGVGNPLTPPGPAKVREWTARPGEGR